jgi:hypothetical protein
LKKKKTSSTFWCADRGESGRLSGVGIWLVNPAIGKDSEKVQGPAYLNFNSPLSQRFSLTFWFLPEL